MSDYICALNETVERTHVRYPNRYGLMLAGDLYMAKDIDKTKPQMALIVGAPYGCVKEQGSCVYCNHYKPCPVSIDIGLVNKYYDLARNGDPMALSRSCSPRGRLRTVRAL